MTKSPNTSTEKMAATKRVVDDAGSYREVSIPAVIFWAGDGYDHWHVHDAEAYELIRLDNGHRVGTGAKHGFCHFDDTPTGSRWRARPTPGSTADAVAQRT
jgi:hypothetical protein